jgi:hypothetical protein
MPSITRGSLEISDDYYDKFIHVADAFPAEKIHLKSKKSFDR